MAGGWTKAVIVPLYKDKVNESESKSSEHGWAGVWCGRARRISEPLPGEGQGGGRPHYTLTPTTDAESCGEKEENVYIITG